MTQNIDRYPITHKLLVDALNYCSKQTLSELDLSSSYLYGAACNYFYKTHINPWPALYLYYQGDIIHEPKEFSDERFDGWDDKSLVLYSISRDWVDEHYGRPYIAGFTEILVGVDKEKNGIPYYKKMIPRDGGKAYKQYKEGRIDGKKFKEADTL